MDNKINKHRLYDFFSYEWIMMLIVIIASIIVWELVYTVSAVRLTVGQQFKYYYDNTIDAGSQSDFNTFIFSNDVFSYDVLEVNSEAITDQMDILSIRLSVQEGDVLFTDKLEPDKDNKDKSIRAKKRIDTIECMAYDFNEMLRDAETYLRDNFFVDSFKDKDLDSIEYKAENIDDSKIKSVFDERMKKDNRFRKSSEKEEGYKLEKGRITQLCKEVTDFKYIMENGPEELFYRYTKYEQASVMAQDESMKKDYAQLVEEEKNAGRENAVYGFNLGALSGGNKNPSTYFRVKGKDNANDVVAIVFGYKKYQPHLQYETISFLNAIVRECSNILAAA